jgi:hypothetical protein
MSNYKFRAVAINNVDVHGGGRSINIELDMDTPQARAAFITLAGDCRLNELGEWMAELGYEIKEIEEIAA